MAPMQTKLSETLFSAAKDEDLDFDQFDDQIDDKEECCGANRAARFSIRCLDLNSMMAEKEMRISLLSRASLVNF